MKKRILALLLAALLVAGCLPMTAGAATSGMCGDNAYWSFNADTGTLTISGSGTMYDYSYIEYEDDDAAPWLISTYDDAGLADRLAICEGTKSIVLTEGITHIGANSFDNEYGGSYMPSLESITIPNTVVSIGNGAFYSNCPNEIFIPASVKQIGTTGYDTPWIGTPDDYGCDVFSSANLQKIVVDEENEYYKSIDGILYKKGDKPALIQYPNGKSLDELFLPSDLEVLNMWETTGPKTLHVPASVSTVKNLASLLGSGEDREVYFYGDAPKEFSFYAFEDAPFPLITLTVFYPANASGWDKVISICNEWQANLPITRVQFETWMPETYPTNETINDTDTGDDPSGDTDNSGKPDNSGDNNTGGNTDNNDPITPDDKEEPDNEEEPNTSFPSIFDFTDLNPDGWYRDAIEFVLEHGLMSGTGNTTFEPNSTLTRAMLVQILYNLEDKPAAAGTGGFTDVSASAWYADAVAWAAANKVVAGHDNGTFAPESAITREQMAVIFRNYTAFKGESVTASGSLAGFTDGGKTSDWAADAMQWAVGSGLFSGKENGILDPVGKSTRAEAAVVLMKFLT